MINQPRVTITQVAEQANVSKMTVSRVLNGQTGVSEQTRQRVLDTIESLGYVANPAARTLRGASKVIGLVAPGITSVYMGQVIAGISKAADRLDYGLMLYTQGVDHESRSKYYASLLSNGLADGVVMIAPYDDDVLVSAFKQHLLPFVMIDHGKSQIEPSVTATNRKGVLDAMRHLMAMGHRRIGFITGRLSIDSSQERLQGYRDALAEVGLPYYPELIREGDFEQSAGFMQAQYLLQQDSHPTAIFCSNDMMAFGAMDAIKDMGLRVGRDISVVGFDDIPMASQVHPALTTVRQPMSEMGEAAVELLSALMQSRTPVFLQQELATELIVRQSTGRAPGST